MRGPVGYKTVDYGPGHHRQSDDSVQLTCILLITGPAWPWQQQCHHVPNNAVSYVLYKC